MLVSLGVLALGLCWLLAQRSLSVTAYYWAAFGLGLSTGYWAVLVTTAAEQFGTNLRATVTTTIPNLVRAVVIPLSLLYQRLVPSWGTIQTVRWLGLGCVALALWAIWTLPESYHRELAFLEQEPSP
jgi:hypothetical protein